MTKRLKIIISVVTAVIVCAFAAVSIVLVLNKKDGIDHLITDENGFTLVRNSLNFYETDESGVERRKTDNSVTDFTDPSNDNIFGLTGSVTVSPGSKITANMEIANTSDSSFVYWLGLNLNGNENELFEQLKITVKVSDSPLQTEAVFVNGQAMLGNASQPIAKVLDGNSSEFSVTVEFKHNSSLNDGAQNQTAVFDLVVYAVPQATV